MKMSVVLKIFIFISFNLFSFDLSSEIFIPVKDYDHQFTKDRAVIKPLYYPKEGYNPFRELKSYIETNFDKYTSDIDNLKDYKINEKKLDDRGEAHITLITPPEGKSYFRGTDRIGIDEYYPIDKIIKDFEKRILAFDFEVVCLGRQVEPAKKLIVFYLVVKNPAFNKLRKTIFNIAEDNRGTQLPKIHPLDPYYAHITIGYISGDVYNVSKGTDTCIDWDINWI